MELRVLKEQLRRAADAGLSRSQTLPANEASIGTVYVLPAGRKDAVFWMLIEREPALFVAVDQHPLSGPCDLEIGVWPISWTARCEYAVRLAFESQDLVAAMTFPADAVAAIRTRRVEIQQNALNPSPQQEEALLDPEYLDLQNRLAAACEKLTGSAPLLRTSPRGTNTSVLSQPPLAEISDEEILQMLKHWRDGDSTAIDRLLPLILQQVHDLARKALRGEDPHVDFQPTELVNEVYLQLVGASPGNFEDSRQFFNYLASIIRNILRDAGRRRRSLRRGGDLVRISFDESMEIEQASSIEASLAISEALDQLSEVDERRAKIVELRYFLGLPFDEIKDIFQISRAQVYRDWDAARVFLKDALKRKDS